MLIQCIECGGKLSDKAISCPHCGCPANAKQVSAAAKKKKGLTKRKDGRYAKQIKIGLKDGKPIKKTIYGHTRSELDKNYVEFMSLKNKGIIIEDSNVSIPELAREWYRVKKQPNLNQNKEANKVVKTDQEYNVKLRQIDKLFEGVKVKDATEYLLESKLLELAKDGKTYSAKAILGVLKRVFRYAIKLHIIYLDPTMDIVITHKYKKNRALMEMERKRIEKVSLEPFDMTLLYTIRYTGMRIGEVVALQKNDIDFSAMRISVNKIVVDNNGKPVIQMHTKTEAGMRECPILDPLISVLQNYISTLPGEQNYLFLNKNSNLFSANSLSWVMRRWRKQVPLADDISFHTFRHNFITECFEANISIAKVQKWVGHDDIHSTMNVYNHLQRVSFEDGEQLNEFYKGKSKTSQTLIVDKAEVL